MHRLGLKFFEFLRNVLSFLKILMLLFIMLHLLYWIEHLTGSNFGWLGFFKPVLDTFLYIGEFISKGSANFAGTIFEYKYFIAVLIYTTLFFVFNFLILFVNNLEDKYDDLDRFVRKTQEAAYNMSLKAEQEKKEKTISKYKVIVKTVLKKEFSYKELGYDIKEQNKLMNKFLMKKTNTAPIEYEGGFVYSFWNFNAIDSVLQVLFEMIHSDLPLNYIIGLQVVENGEKACMADLKKIAELEHLNKIVTFANTVYRYSFNVGNKYKTSQLGLFQKGNDTLELHEFIENNYI